MNRKVKASLAAIFMTAALAGCGTQPAPLHEDLSYTEFMSRVEKGEVKKISVDSDAISKQQTIHWTVEKETVSDTGEKVTVPEIEYTILTPMNENLYDRLRPHKVEMTFGNSELPPNIAGFVIIGLLLGGFGAYLSKHHWLPPLMALFNGKKKKQEGAVTFKDIAGVDEAMEEVQDVLEYLKDPKKFKERGLKPPRGILLTGPPGNGKTLLAKALAGEAAVNIVTKSGPDFNSSMWKGVATMKVKSAFAEARALSPCILFIDEIDALGRARSTGPSNGGGAQEDSDNALNQLLIELDGFDSDKTDVVLMAATNRPEVLDEALVRSGRLERHVPINKPDLTNREKIAAIYLRKFKCGPDVTAKAIAEITPGFSGADIASLINWAGKIALREDRPHTEMADIDAARDHVLMGAKNRSLLMTPEERDITAYHESGHAIVTHKLAHADPIYKATIIPRGKSLGAVIRQSEGDPVLKSLAALKADLAVAVAGRVAEELIFGEDNITTGAAGDFQQTEKTAYAMVRHYGMSTNLAKRSFSEQQTGKISESTKRQIEREEQRFIDEAMNTAREIIVSNWDQFHALADALKARETLSSIEIAEIIGPNVKRETLNPRREKPALKKG